MRTIKNAVDRDAPRLQQFLHLVVHGLQIGFAVKPAGDAGLIAGDGYEIARLFQTADSLDAARNRVPLVDRFYLGWLLL